MCRSVTPGRRLRAEMVLTQGRLDDLAIELQAIIESSGTALPDDEHDAEGSTIGFERARVSALVEGARVRLAKLIDGLGRLDAGSYGRCSACGEAISPERLEALPDARTCLDCAQVGLRRQLTPGPAVWRVPPGLPCPGPSPHT